MWPFGKKKRKAAKIKVGPCEITYYDRDGRPMSEAEVERERRRTELARIEREAEQEARRSAMAALGANVGALTDERLTVDALDVANAMCGAKVRRDKKPSRVERKWSKLTKAGRAPKCIMRSTVIFDYKNGDSVIAHLSYAADAVPYAGEFHVWRGDDCRDYKMATVDGEFRLVD